MGMLVTQILPRLGWSLFLIGLLVVSFIATGSPFGTTFAVLAIIAVLLASRFPYVAFNLSLASSVLLGILVSIPAGDLRFGERAFGGSIDIGLGELIAATVLAAWAIRMLLLWRGRRDHNWKPWLPLFGAFAALVLAHILSLLSVANPDPLLVLKYSLRPILLVYIISVALPVNFIRSQRRLRDALLVIAAVGTFFALDGLRSLFVFEQGDAFLYRARPLPILGVSPIGENHNVLAELLLFTGPVALAYGLLAKAREDRLIAFVAAGFMTLVALLTFARSAWIALGVEVLLVSIIIGRGWIKERIKYVWLATVCFIPFVLYMGIFSASSGVQSSTDARAMLSGIAWQLYLENPVVGVGAGSFVTHIARTRAYTIEFGAPMDSHGVLQKLIAETGTLGLLAFLFLVYVLARRLWQAARGMNLEKSEGKAFVFLCVAVAGAFTYQLFNTTYWTSKLWLPVGLALAATRVLEGKTNRDPDFLAPKYET